MYGRNPDDYKEYQVLGAHVQTILDGFGSFTLLASQILIEEGLGVIDQGSGLARLDPEKWYPVPPFMRALERIQAEFGEYTLRQSGIHINKRVATAGGAGPRDLDTAMSLMDAGYLINHARSGVPMFSSQTSTTTEGIGHYRPRPGTPRNQVIVNVDDLYPCAFAWGIVEGVALMFDPKAQVLHDPTVCRKMGKPHCTYTVNHNASTAKQ